MSKTPEGSIIVGLDIGTTKITVIVGRKNEHGKIEILGMGKAPSTGVMRGIVSNIDKTTQSIQKALEEAIDSSGLELKNVNVGIAGQHIKSLQHRGQLVRENLETEINDADIDKLMQNMYKLVMVPGEEIIHVIPHVYIVDKQDNFPDPRGMVGVQIEANFHIITGQIAAGKNIYRCVEKAGLEVADIILEPLASAESVLSEEEKEAGVALVDIGGGTTDIAIFHEGIIRHTAVIPFGGNVITDDIKEGTTIMKRQAELLKQKYGTAFASKSQENEIVCIPGLRGREPKEISVKNLSNIIQARMEEIIEHIHFEIKNSGYEKKLIGGVVITGGGSQLKYLPRLFEFVTGMNSRVGYPNEHVGKGIQDDITSPLFATGIGLVHKGFEDLEKSVEAEAASAGDVITSTTKKRGSFFDSLMQKGKTWFEVED